MRRGTFLDLLAALLGRRASCPSGGHSTFAHRASTDRNKKLARGVRHPAPTPCALRLIQVAHPRWRRHQHRQHPQMPQMAKNAITPMTVHMTMLFILHLRFVLSKGPIPPDAHIMHYFPCTCLLAKQRKSNSNPITAERKAAAAQSPPDAPRYIPRSSRRLTGPTGVPPVGTSLLRPVQSDSPSYAKHCPAPMQRPRPACAR